jgi:hypothetical protein
VLEVKREGEWKREGIQKIARTAQRPELLSNGGVLVSFKDTSLQTLPDPNFGSRFKAIGHANM